MFHWMNDHRFGVVTTRLILIMVIGFALLPWEPSLGERNPALTTFLSGLPQVAFDQPMIVYGLQAVVVLSSVMWLLGWAVPLSCWAAVLSLAGLSAMRMEQATEPCHGHVWLWMLLLIHAVWYSFYFVELSGRAADQDRRRHYPAWVLGLSIFVVAWFHTLSGIGKWLSVGPDWTTGWNWADGVSLQLWLHALGNPASRFVQWLMQDQSAALVIQRVWLVIELTAIFAVFNATLRRCVGCLLAVYYLFFLHCFVDWTALMAFVGLGSAPVEVSNGAWFPAASYAFQLFWVVWLFLVSDQMLGRWERPSEQ
jgi:hypothetical protein